MVCRGRFAGCGIKLIACSPDVPPIRDVGAAVDAIGAGSPTYGHKCQVTRRVYGSRRGDGVT
jgi:hypothetical protein